ncbi:hypothetical protein PA598K_01168 [Paenibacillus sp. 598K]|uniref:hypothetical protein n=1 Tax=Paenibacillus sp. 598K TaxID=1117987 RepID=UPI000FFACB8E|nr:hypothetical protein [Paenibacillus sp. 598K]GBF72891.1 hypothetical protein PA598K_01168 [Paenibacillus sp. 598K]
MRYPVTIIATIIGLALCLYNSTGYDPHNFVFFMFSVPAWFVDLFIDVHEVSVLLMYVATVLCYALIGYIADRIIMHERSKRPRRAR